MNPVEIEAAVSDLILQPFDGEEFPFSFLRAFGNKETTIKRLLSGETNKSDLGGVLQSNNIHIAIVQSPNSVSNLLSELKSSRATLKAKARYILATDGLDLEAEDLDTGETIACSYHDLPNHFGFFLPLAGISTIKQVRDSSFDIRATGRLNRLYVELLKDNPEWGKAERRHEMNHFISRLIFCFFAEDTGIFSGASLFTKTVEQMSTRDASNVDQVINKIFTAMNTKTIDREKAKLPRWADTFPYVNGGLFSGEIEVPKFSKIARSYLLHIGNLDWTKINPDIFGSMIQAVADEEERGALGMHYTSIPNILKVLNPLFLDDLRIQLEAADNNPRKLLNLRKRLAKIRIFDPACGSGNFLVVAYKQMREIENIINERRSEQGRKSDIPLTNFRGIEIRHFSAEIARLALIIAEFQCDVLYRGVQLALSEFLPLSKENWITYGNALRMDWLSICPPTGTDVDFHVDNLFNLNMKQSEIDFENEGGETYICGNPPYKGSREQLPEQKEDLKLLFSHRVKGWKTLDYVAGWFIKAADYGMETSASSAFVSTNSICQGQHVPILWPLILDMGHEIAFAHTDFKWANLASYNAGVTVVVIGISNQSPKVRKLFSIQNGNRVIVKEVENISPYLVAGANVIVSKLPKPISDLDQMNYGNYPGDGKHLTISSKEALELETRRPDLKTIIRPLFGAQEFIKGLSRYCLWIDDDKLNLALSDPMVANRVKAVRETRLASRDTSLNKLAVRSHQFRDRNIAKSHLILVPTVSSERRNYIPVDIKSAESVTTNQAFALYDTPLWNMAIISSRLHLIWIATVCGKMKTDFRYSNTLGWNTFPFPRLTEKNKVDLVRCAEDILLAREEHFPATIADLYDPENMPDNLREAHERNDEMIERIYIGRRFRNDTERLEKLFDLYTKTSYSADSNKKKKGQKTT